MPRLTRRRKYSINKAQKIKEEVDENNAGPGKYDLKEPEVAEEKKETKAEEKKKGKFKKLNVFVKGKEAAPENEVGNEMNELVEREVAGEVKEAKAEEKKKGKKLPKIILHKEKERVPENEVSKGLNELVEREVAGEVKGAKAEEKKKGKKLPKIILHKEKGKIDVNVAGKGKSELEGQEVEVDEIEAKSEGKKKGNPPKREGNIKSTPLTPYNHNRKINLEKVNDVTYDLTLINTQSGDGKENQDDTVVVGMAQKKGAIPKQKKKPLNEEASSPIACRTRKATIMKRMVEMITSTPKEPPGAVVKSSFSWEDLDEESTREPPVPNWSTRKERNQNNEIQKDIPEEVVNAFFGVQPISVDLKEIFPNIKAKDLKRNDSDIWNTPPPNPSYKE